MSKQAKLILSGFLALTHLLLVFPGQVIYGMAAKQKKGAEIVVEKYDGSSVQGELLIIKGRDLYVLDAMSAEVKIGIDEIKTIRVVKKSVVGKHVLGVSLFGAGVGAVLGAIIFSGKESGSTLSGPAIGLGGGALGGAILLGGAGLVVGTITGIASSKDEVFNLSNKSEAEINRILVSWHLFPAIPESDKTVIQSAIADFFRAGPERI